MRVLVVDDDPMIVTLLELNLELSGHEVVTCGDAEEGLRLAGATRPDVVVLDVMLPGMDGDEACVRLREDPRTAALPVVLLSARTLDADRERGIAAGATDYVTKPFDPVDLVDHLERLVADGAA